MASITVNATRTISAPPETVWAFICQPARYPEWVAVTDRLTHGDDDLIGEGTEYGEIGGIGPFTGESE